MAHHGGRTPICPLPFRGRTVVALLVVIVLTLRVAHDSPGRPNDHATTADDAVSSRAALPVHEPGEWAFWDQMASAFSTEPVPTDLLDGPGVIFRWWFDRTWVGGDVVPRDCSGITLWLDEFERYGFEAGTAFVASRSGPCPLT